MELPGRREGLSRPHLCQDPAIPDHERVRNKLYQGNSCLQSAITMETNVGPDDQCGRQIHDQQLQFRVPTPSNRLLYDEPSH
jgi:hypothetical protein